MTPFPIFRSRTPVKTSIGNFGSGSGRMVVLLNHAARPSGFSFVQKVSPAVVIGHRIPRSNTIVSIPPLAKTQRGNCSSESAADDDRFRVVLALLGIRPRRGHTNRRRSR